MSSFIYCKLPYRFIKKGAPYYYVLLSKNGKILRSEISRKLIECFELCKQDGLWPGPKSKQNRAYMWRRVAETINISKVTTFRIEGKQCRQVGYLEKEVH